MDSRPQAFVRGIGAAENSDSIVNASPTPLVRNQCPGSVYGQEVQPLESPAASPRRWGWRTPLKKRPPPGVLNLPKSLSGVNQPLVVPSLLAAQATTAKAASVWHTANVTGQSSSVHAADGPWQTERAAL